jgi:penicillin-binding protein 1A
MRVSDSPISIAMGRGLGIYSPKNMTTHYYGTVPLRVGLQKSLNKVTIRLVHQFVGMKPVAKMIEKFGIVDHVPMQLAMALGAGETTLLRLATAYAMLANGGKRLEPALIDRIQDRHGNTIFTADTRLCKNCKDQLWNGGPPPVIEDLREQLADPRSIYQITSMLEGAVRAGTARKAQVLGKILAAKTGTSNEERDAWTVAYTSDIVVGVHVGYDSPKSLGHMEGGARVALPFVVDFLGKALDGVPSKPFKMPSGMKLVRMKEMTGQAAKAGDAGAIYEALKANQGLYQGGSSSSSTEDGSQYKKSYGESFDSLTPQDVYAPSLEPSLPSSPAFRGTGGIY